MIRPLTNGISVETFKEMSLKTQKHISIYLMWSSFKMYIVYSYELTCNQETIKYYAEIWLQNEKLKLI
jgi:hypothetical protein